MSKHTSLQSEVSKIMEQYQVHTVRFCEFLGDIPREELHKVHWSPAEGALLASGIMTLEGDPVIDKDLLLFSGISKWRINHSICCFDQWSKEHHPSHPIHPSEFLSWLEKNPIPKLDYRGKKIDVDVKPVQEEDTSDNSSKTAVTGSPKPPPKTRRQTELQEYLAAAIMEAGSDRATAVFNVLREWALNEKRPFSLIEGGELGYTSNNNVSKKLNLRNIQSALKRRKERLDESDQ